MAGVNGWEFLFLIVLVLALIGPDRLPEYASKLTDYVRRFRQMAEGAKTDLKEQLGPEYQDLNWRQYDPRQYDPRRIVREALVSPLEEATRPLRDEVSEVTAAAKDLVKGPTATSAVGAGTDVDEDTVQFPVADEAPVGEERVADALPRPVPFDAEAT